MSGGARSALKADLTIKAFAEGGFGVYLPGGEPSLFNPSGARVQVFAASTIEEALEFIRAKLVNATQPRPSTEPKPQSPYEERGGTL